MGIFSRINKGLKKTRENMSGAIDSMLHGKTEIDDEFYDELEEILVMGDVGCMTASEIVEKLRERVMKKHLRKPEAVKNEIKEIVAEMLEGGEEMSLITLPSVILVIGVNGVGKTTSIGKLAAMYKNEGKKVILAAADTFRAAAIEQLEEWANRAGVEIVKHREGADPAAVIYDTIQAGKARNADIIICDTAGRLHNKKNLMEELAQIYRVIDRELPYSDRESLLVLDATTGQNAVNQAKEFKNVAEITGIILTKLDGTAKGGVVLNIKNELGVPVKFIGVGEKLDQIEPFYPDRMASRILGMGDVLTLIEKAEQSFDEKKALEMAERMKANRFSLSDYLDQMRSLKGMGDINDLAGMIPGVDAKALKGAKVDEKGMARIEAIILSMTQAERDDPTILNASRKKRIAAGSGTSVVDVNRLLKQFDAMQGMMRQLSGKNMKKLQKRFGGMGGGGGFPGLGGFKL